MTTLGLVFLAAYVAAAARGYRNLLVVVAATASFNDSAMISLGPIVVSPFYMGLLLLLGGRALAVGASQRRMEPPGRGSGLLGVLLAYALLVTALAPLLLHGVGVIAPRLGLDEQVDRLSPLAYSSSNVAQLTYLSCAVALVLITSRDALSGSKMLSWAFGLGIAVSLSAWVAGKAGVAWPHFLFDNSPRNFYATIDPRLRAQFAEPSHLGAFALAASLFYSRRLLGARSLRSAAGPLCLALGSLLLVSASGSATGLLGLAVAVVVLLVIAGTAYGSPAAQRFRLPPALAAAGLVVAAILLLAGPALVRYYVHLVEMKQATSSYSTRGYSNHVAIGLLRQSYFFGVGLGSNRSSSLAFLLLAGLGLPGLIIFLAVLARCFRNGLASPDRAPLVWSLAGLISAMFISYADFASPVLWLLVAGTYSALQTGRRAGPDSRLLGSGGHASWSRVTEPSWPRPNTFTDRSYCVEHDRLVGPGFERRSRA